ncbi:MAG: alginate lyase family protein [Vicinamibacterales bacterium]
MTRVLGWLPVIAGLVITSTHLDAMPGEAPPRTAEETIRQADQTAARPRLLREAEKALIVGPFSVMQKARIAPSGDKHDFLTLAPYWWPDPTKPGGLPYIRRDGETNPESKRDTDDVPFGQMIEALKTLTAAYRETRDERFGARAALLLRVWFLDPATRMNPNVDYGQGIPGRNTGRGAGIITLRHLVHVVDAARVLSGSPSWTEQDRAGLQAWSTAYARWLQDSRHGREEAKATNNHGTWYEAHLVALQLYTGKRDDARARAEKTKQRIASQIEPDGRQPRELERTRSWSYSVMNLDGWFNLARFAEEVNVDLWHFKTADGRSLKAALDYIVPAASGSVAWPDRQITSFDWQAFVPLLDQAAIVWKQDDYKTLADRLRAADR